MVSTALVSTAFIKPIPVQSLIESAAIAARAWALAPAMHSASVVEIIGGVVGVEEDSCPEVEEEETVTAEAVAICAASANLID